MLLLAAPFLLFPSPATTPVLLIVPSLWVISWLAGDAPLPYTPLNVTLLLLNLMVLVSTQVSYDLAVSLPKIAGMVLGIGVFYAFVNYSQGSRGFGMCLVVLLTTGLGVALISLLGTEWTIKFDFLTGSTYRFAPRITGLPGAESGLNPNEVGGALLWVIPLFLALSVTVFTQQRNWHAAIQRRARPLGLLLAEATLFVIFVFLLSQSRGAFLALAITSLVLIPIALPIRWRRLFLSGLAIICIFGGSIFTWRYGLEGAQSLVFGDRPINDPVSLVYTLDARTRVWSWGLFGVQKFPITGMGMNTFQHVINALNPLDPPYPEHVLGHAHNEFLQAAIDLGIPGLVAFVALYLGAFWMLSGVWRGTRQQLPDQSHAIEDSLLNHSSSIRLLVLGLSGSLVSHGVYGFTDAVALGAKPGIIFWMLLGVIVGLFQRRQQAIQPSVSAERGRHTQIRNAR